MKSCKKRLTLDLDVPFQRRLKVIAALRGVSMHQYCLVAIDKELDKDEADRAITLPFREQSLNRGNPSVR